MHDKKLDQAFGPTPELFSERIDQTLQALEEEKPMKRLTIRTVLIAALILALLCGIAYAVITQGQEWYYNNRFTAYLENDPEKHQAIMENLQAVSEQSQQDDPLVVVTMQDASWVPEERMLSISLRAMPRDAGVIELHPMWNLDADGSYVGPGNLEEYADDEEARAEHWLWTERGFGPVREYMTDPNKALYLFEADEFFIGTPEEKASARGNGSSMDSFVGDDGAVITVLETEMPWMDEAYDDEILANENMSDDTKAFIVEENRAAREALKCNLDENGMLTLSVSYTVWPYVEGDDYAFYDGGIPGWVTFRVKIR